MALFKGGKYFEVSWGVLARSEEGEGQGCSWPGVLACVMCPAWCEQGSAARLEPGKEAGGHEVPCEDTQAQLLIGGPGQLLLEKFPAGLSDRTTIPELFFFLWSLTILTELKETSSL